MFSFNGKNVVYVGDMAGFGYQMCRLLVKEQVKNLMICCRMTNMEMLKKLQDEAGTQVNVHMIQMNILDNGCIMEAVRQIVGVTKTIDVLINCASVLADKDVHTTIGVNLTGLIDTTLACMPYMDKSQMGNGGVVMNICSMYGLENGMSSIAVYSAAKHGVIGFIRSMADDHFYGKTGVCFVGVCPGMTVTEAMMLLRENANVSHHQQQPIPEACATNVMKVMQTMKNGSIYMCHGGQVSEVERNVVQWH